MRAKEEVAGLARGGEASSFAVPLRNLLRRPGRSIMTGAAVAISMALLISMFSISTGLKESVTRELLESREDLAIFPEQGLVENVHQMTLELASWEEVEFATAALYYDLTISLPPQMPEDDPWNKTVQAFGVIPSQFWDLMGETERERFAPEQWFTVPSDPHYADGTYEGDFTGEVLLSDNLRKFGVRLGDRLPVFTVEGEKVNMTVRGFFETEFSGLGYTAELSFAMLHLSELQTLTNMGIETGGEEDVLVDLGDGVSIALTPAAVREGRADDVKRRIQELYPEYTDDVFTKNDQLGLMEQESALAEAFYIAVGSVSMLIGLLFVATIMIVSVLERTQEIGMLRAIGISRRTIFIQIVTESMVLVFLGALVGIAPGYYGAEWAAGHISETLGNEIILAFSMLFVIKAILWVLVVGVLFAMYPAYIAVRMNIVQAIQRAHISHDVSGA